MTMSPGQIIALFAIVNIIAIIFILSLVVAFPNHNDEPLTGLVERTKAACLDMKVKGMQLNDYERQICINLGVHLQ